MELQEIRNESKLPNTSKNGTTGRIERPIDIAMYDSCMDQKKHNGDSSYACTPVLGAIIELGPEGSLSIIATLVMLGVPLSESAP